MTPLERELFDRIDEAINRIMRITNQTTVYDLAMLVIRDLQEVRGMVEYYE